MWWGCADYAPRLEPRSRHKRPSRAYWLTQGRSRNTSNSTALARRAPTFQIESVENNPSEDTHVARVVTGTFEVPDFLSTPGIASGSVLNANESGTPEQLDNDDVSAPFECEIPSALPTGSGCRTSTVIRPLLLRWCPTSITSPVSSDT